MDLSSPSPTGQQTPDILEPRKPDLKEIVIATPSPSSQTNEVLAVDNHESLNNILFHTLSVKQTTHQLQTDSEKGLSAVECQKR